MLRQTIIQTLRPSIRSALNPTSRTLTTTARTMAGGDTGAPKSGGSAQSDAFSKREQADENLYVRQKEQEKLQELKKKIEDHKKHLDDLDKHVTDQMNSGSGKN
ncbi:mitochondrial ATPase inhibitor, IATP-domain-containing protein [Usnea florida]